MQVNKNAANACISPNPLLSPTAAESNEPANANRAASAIDRLFELSISAAVSSRYSLIISGVPRIFMVRSPESEI